MVRARLPAITATRALAAASCAVNQRPCGDRRVEQRPAWGSRSGTASLPSNLSGCVRLGCARATPGVMRISRAARASSCVPTAVFSSMSQRAWFQTSFVVFVTVSISASTASSVAHRERDLRDGREAAPPRRVTLRTPICAVRGRNASRRSARSSTACPPCNAGTSSRPSRTGMREPRRIAGSAASGGATSPTQDARDHDRQRDLEAGRDREEARAEETDDRVRDNETERRPRSPTLPLRAAARCAGRCGGSGGGCRRSPSSFRSRAVCSPISVVIVFAISTSPASSASTVNTFMIEASWSNSSLPG